MQGFIMSPALYLPPSAGITRIRCKGHPLRDLSAFAPLVFGCTDCIPVSAEIQYIYLRFWM